MQTYIKFLTYNFLKSLIYVFFIMISLAFILNLLSELEFFKEINVDFILPLFLALLNSPTMIFEMFPFIFLIGTQLFFINLFNNNEIEIFKYSGLKNSKILLIISTLSILIGIFLTTIFYNFSSNLKNFYLELKSPYTSDGKYLAVITKNGLWIKDQLNEKILIVNSSEIKGNFLINNFITEFDKNFSIIRNIQSKKINISKKKWVIHNARVYKNNNYEDSVILNIDTNFDYERIQTLYSNLSSLNIIQLLELRKNYKKLKLSITEVDLQILKLTSYPIYLFLMTLFSSLIMFRIKRFQIVTFKIALGLFFSVIIYYVNNFFNVLGSTERIPLVISIFLPLIFLILLNSAMIKNINEK